MENLTLVAQEARSITSTNPTLVRTRNLTMVPSEPGDRGTRESMPPPASISDGIVVSCPYYPTVCDDRDKFNVVRPTANPFDNPSRPSAFQPYTRSLGRPNMEASSHYFSPVVTDVISDARYLPHGSRPPSRRRSRASSRASSRMSGADMSWIGPFMTKLADDTNEWEKRMMEEANEREKRMTDEAHAREQRMMDEAHTREQATLSREQLNLDLMKELLRERELATLAREQLSYEREEKHQALASQREEAIRQEMRQYAAMDARAAALEE